MTNFNPTKPRAIYLLPNLLTTAALFSSFYAIIANSQGHFMKALVAFYLAALMDALDGRVARLMGAQSEFGAQYDSLSDMIAFGLTPALIAYHNILSYLGHLGLMLAFCYLVCTALRLARFNVEHGKSDIRYFRGLPSPIAAIVLMGALSMLGQLDFSPIFVWIIAFLSVGLALLMVSNLLYFSFKSLDFKGKVSFMRVLIMVLIFIIVMLKPFICFFLVALMYTLSGVFLMFWRLLKKRRSRK